MDVSASKTNYKSKIFKMRKLRVLYPLIVLMAMLSLQGCGPIEDDEDLLIGRTWYWIKTEHYFPYGQYDNYTEYKNDDVFTYKFWSNGDITMRESHINRFGDEIISEENGVWDLWGDDLTIKGEVNDYFYEIETLTSFDLVLVSTYEYDLKDDYGRIFRVREKTRMFFER